MRIVSISVVAFCLAFASSCGGNKGNGTGGGSGGSSGTGGTGGSSGGGTTNNDGGTGGSTGGSSGAGGGASNNDGGTGISLAMVCQGFADATCNRGKRCGQVDPTTTGLCTALAKQACATKASATTAGIYTYSATAAQQCINDFAAFACTQDATTPPSCGGVFTPASTPGHQCIDTCATGYCAGNGNACRTCTGYAAIGQPCNGGSFLGTLKCDPATAYCPDGNGTTGLDGGARVCLAFAPNGTDCSQVGIFQDPPCAQCITRPDAGRSCGFESVGEPCQSDTACGTAAYCKGLVADCSIICSVSKPGVCAARIALGANCTNEHTDDGCASGGTCLDGRCVALPQFSRTLGQECDSPGECVSGAYCSGSSNADGGSRVGTCTARADAGFSCAPERANVYLGEDPCVTGAYCPPLSAQATCIALGGIGSECDRGHNCKLDLECFVHDGGFSDTGVCKLPAAPGDPCGVSGFPINYGVSCSSEAGPNYFCQGDGGNAIDSAFCEPPSVVGAPCTGAYQCVSGQCYGNDGGSENATCRAPCF